MLFTDFLWSGLRFCQERLFSGRGALASSRSRSTFRRLLVASALAMVVVAGSVAPASATTNAVPEPPSRPSATWSVVDGTMQVTLSWSDPGDSSITGYQILRRDRAVDPPGQFHVIEEDTGSADTSYVDATVVASRSYVYRVKARNAEGLSSWSRYRRIELPDLPTPPPSRHVAEEPALETSPQQVGDQSSTPPPPSLELVEEPALETSPQQGGGSSSTSATYQECLDQIDAGAAVKCTAGRYSIVTYGSDGTVWVDWSRWADTQTDIAPGDVASLEVVQSHSTVRTNWRGLNSGNAITTEGEHGSLDDVRYTYSGQNSCANVADPTADSPNRRLWRCPQPAAVVFDHTEVSDVGLSSADLTGSGSRAIQNPQAPEQIQETLMRMPTGRPADATTALTATQLADTIEATATENKLTLVALKAGLNNGTTRYFVLTMVYHY